MKTLITLLFASISYISYSQSQTLSFNYDNAGNQTKRELICIGCKNSNPDNPMALQDEYIQSTEYPQIQYFPNPVTYELQVKWNTENGGQLSSIQIYSISGQYIHTYANLEKQNEIRIPFSSYPEGMYSLLLQYNNGDQKSFKVLKKQE